MLEEREQKRVCFNCDLYIHGKRKCLRMPRFLRRGFERKFHEVSMPGNGTCELWMLIDGPEKLGKNANG